MELEQNTPVSSPENVITAVKPTSEINEQFNQECLEEHNRLRALHGCPPLELDRNLAAKAQEHTEVMALKNQMHHRLSPNHGENLSMREGNIPTVITGKQATLRWYSEVQRFHYGEERQSMSGNFSQIIWKSSTHAGFGLTTKNGGCNIFIAAYYRPSGNVSGHFTENVPRPLNGVDYLPSNKEMGW
ncbi:unnamed protein product [Fasciola hepatica]|uniref:Venom allergen protein 13 n=2 Tax=Fasciola hepatica TaxID=6192 RepID=A0A4E0RB78_FASHE|nr:Venom allergen protein 13 [Fasciola hepatica]CAK6928291.1 unnamed protein product [Fasciola hepatica]